MKRVSQKGRVNEMEIKIRHAKESDLENIVKMNKSLFEEDSEFDKTLNMDWPDSKGKDYFLKVIERPEGCMLIAEIEGKVIGYLEGRVRNTFSYRTKVKMAELENMLVKKPFRNRGVGKSLVREFVIWCKSKSVRRIAVTASEKNVSAIKFYESVGFFKYSLMLEMEMVE